MRIRVQSHLQGRPYTLCILRDAVFFFFLLISSVWLRYKPGLLVLGIFVGTRGMKIGNADAVNFVFRRGKVLNAWGFFGLREIFVLFGDAIYANRTIAW